MSEKKRNRLLDRVGLTYQDMIVVMGPPIFLRVPSS
jgi:hypothetical protein